MGEGLELVFWIVAISGSAIFVLKTALMMMGGDVDDGGDLDLDVSDVDGADVDLSDAGHHDGSTSAFNLLSLQSLAIFAMGGGWMSLASLKTFELGNVESIFVGSAFGLLLVYCVGKLLLKARLLESSGTLNVKNAVGQTGTVYLGIPSGGRGQIQVEVQGRLVTLGATTKGDAIATGKRVRVEGVEGSATLVVVPVA